VRAGCTDRRESSLDAVLKRNPQHVRARLARAWIDDIVDAREGQAREHSNLPPLTPACPQQVSLVEAVVWGASSSLPTAVQVRSRILGF
jgi:hypothetical protein